MDRQPLDSEAENARSSQANVVQEICGRLCLPGQVETAACNLYKTLGAGRDVDATATACVYIACRQACVSRSFKEICIASPASVKQAQKAFFAIIPRLRKKGPDRTPPESYINRISARLSLSFPTVKAAQNVAKQLRWLKKPSCVVAASCIRLVCDHSVSDIAEASGVSRALIRATSKVIQKML